MNRAWFKFSLFLLLLGLLSGSVYAENFSLSLKTGDNLISFPLTLQDSDIEDALSSILGGIKDVWTYQAEDSASPWKHFRPGLSAYNSLNSLEPGRGYWLSLKYNLNLQVSGTAVPAQASFRLWKGWNLIGWPYLEARPILEALSGLTFGQDYSVITSFDNATKALIYFYNQPQTDDFSTFQAGKAYYIHMLKDKTVGIGIASPDTPQNLEAQSGTDSVTLTWQAQDNSGLAGYNVYRSSELTGGYEKINSQPLLTNSYIDSGLGQGRQYYYRVTSLDIYGNESSQSLITYRFFSTSVGSQGGEVFSADGRVHLVIPQGALSEAADITILSPLEQYLVNAVPEGQALLCAAEFKPYGLTFNKPVTVIYTLPEAEVPGTQVELGLYNSQTDTINPTGSVSSVATDGYTVTFTIDHFSTYAALKGLFSQGGAPIGSGVDIPLPDMFTGSFGHSVALTIPPGRKGLQPNLSLNYRSSNPNSWLGVGFSLNPGYIVRSTRLGPPSYNDQEDCFYFINDNGSTELVHLTDNLYQAKIESSFTKFFKLSDDTWKVVEKNGMSLYFGQTSASKETAPSGTFSWYLTKAKDTNGNFVEYNYTKDSGKPYLDYIDYTGNDNVSISAPNRIEFDLEDRNDVSSSYISGGEISTSKRLCRIQAKQNNELVWRYELEYSYSPESERSLLTAITQYGADGAALPTQRFRYQSN